MSSLELRGLKRNSAPKRECEKKIFIMMVVHRYDDDGMTGLLSSDILCKDDG